MLDPERTALEAAAQITHEAWCDNCENCSGIYDDDRAQAEAVLAAYFAALDREAPIVLRMGSASEARAVWHAIGVVIELMDAVEAEPGNSIPSHAPLYGQRARLADVARRLDHEINCESAR